MVKHSRGSMSSRTKKLKSRRSLTVVDFIKKFSIGDKIVVVPKPYFKGLPSLRYANRHGVVVEKRGKGYVVEITDGNKKKFLVSGPIHLELSK